MTIDEIIRKLKSAEQTAKRNGTDALKTEVNKAVKLNFIEQGRPAKWKPKKHNDGRAILTGRTGNGQRSINIQEDLNTGTVSVGSSLIYMQAHQTGATIQHKPRTYTYRKKRNGKLVFAGANHRKPAKTVQGKSYVVNLPARPWAVWTDEDTRRAVPVIQRAAEDSFI